MYDSGGYKLPFHTPWVGKPLTRRKGRRCSVASVASNEQFCGCSSSEVIVGRGVRESEAFAPHTATPLSCAVADGTLGTCPRGVCSAMVDAPLVSFLSATSP